VGNQAHQGARRRDGDSGQASEVLSHTVRSMHRQEGNKWTFPFHFCLKVQKAKLSFFSFRKLGPDDSLPFLHLGVTEKGVKLASAEGNLNKRFEAGPYPIESISYGVQDIVYTR